MADLFTPLSMDHGPDWKNRFMLAPLTNLQSHKDGVLSDDEFHWLTKTGGRRFRLDHDLCGIRQCRGHRVSRTAWAFMMTGILMA